MQSNITQQHITTPSEQALAELSTFEAMQHYRASTDQALPTSLKEQHLSKAEYLAKQALQSSHGSAELLNLLGRIALDRNQIADAERLFKKALGLAPQDAGIHYSLGHAYLASRQLSAAEHAFRQALHYDADLFRARTSLAYTLKEQGDTVAAYQLYRELIRERPSDPHTKSKLFECLSELQTEKYSDELARELLYYLSIEGVDYSLMSRMLSTLFSKRYGLEAENAPAIELHALAEDQLLLLSLRKLIIAGPHIEDLLTKLRDALLHTTMESGALDNACVSLAVSLATNAHLTEYAWWICPESQQLLEAISAFLQAECSLAKPDWHKLEIPLLMLAMYQPLSSLQHKETLMKRPFAEWSYFMRPLINQTLIQPADERTRAASIICLTPPSDPTSQAVRHQYEQHPYPRWNTLQYHTETEYSRALSSELPGFTPPSFLNRDDIQILVAGCGTGRHAIYVARYFSRAQVTAIDLSANSLAYAKRMAEHYGLDNITFIQADILELHKMEKRFHIIECSGVLHHMESPRRGCLALRQLLEPGGLIKLGLYSRRARQQVTRYRLAHPLSEGVSPTDLRARRHSLMNQSNTDYQDILASPDFYSLSGFRDLLCHEVEHTFSPLELAQMLEACQLDFLGFIRLTQATRNAYHQAFPDDTQLRNLAHWEQFEAQHPQLFGGMFQFYCQAPS